MEAPTMRKFPTILTSLAVLFVCANSSPAFAQASAPEKLANGQKCEYNENCTSGLCDDVTSKCVVNEPEPAPETEPVAEKLADGEDCKAHDECKNGLCDALKGKCATATTVPVKLAPKSASKKTAAVLVCESDCADDEVCYKGECIADPCLDLPFSDGDTYGCKVAAAVDLRMPRTVKGVRAVLLAKSEKSLAYYQKALEIMTRYYMWEIFDYQVSSPDDFKKEGSDNYWDNTMIRDHLQANSTNLEIMANARLGLPHGPSTIPVPFSGKVKIQFNRD
jgi:hypothetical protein